MGGGRNGDFGNTFDKIMNKLGIDAKDGLSLDEISTILSWASFIPGLDTAVDILSIPVDLIRGDYMSAMFDVVGIVPFVGEIGDTAKLARMTDNAVDAAKVTDKVSNIGKTVVKVPKLPKTPTKLKSSGWKETTSAAMKKNTTSRTFKKDGLTIRFDKGKKGVGGYGGKDHYHILNPKATGKHDYYLDNYGNPVPKNSKASHILP